MSGKTSPDLEAAVLDAGARLLFGPVTLVIEAAFPAGTIIAEALEAAFRFDCEQKTQQDRPGGSLHLNLREIGRI